MADGRMLKKAIADSEKLGLCSDKARVLYLMMLPHLDVKGRLYANPKIIKGQYATMLGYSEKTIQRCLEELHNVRGEESNNEGLIMLYQSNGKQYLQYTRFEDFQLLNPDREAESKIPDPAPDNSGGNRRTPLKLSLSKDKLSLSKDNISVAFSHWNSFKGKKKTPTCGAWKSHKDLTPEIKSAIRTRLKEYPIDEITAAVSNYAKVLLGREYTWTHAWTLQQFLTRHKPDQRDELQFWRFHPNNFVEDDYLTKPAKAARIEKNRQPEIPEPEFLPPTAEERKKLRAGLPENMRKSLERKKASGRKK